MADLSELQQVRLFGDEPDDSNGITDDFINQLLDGGMTVNAASAIVWRVKMGTLAKTISVSTAQTRLELASKFDHAKEMYEMYAGLAGNALSDEGSGDWVSIEMAEAVNAYLADEPESMDAYWPGYGRQWPNRLSGTRHPLV